MATYNLTTSIPTMNILQIGDILNCPYSGTYKQITLPPGQYKLECWGAEGGTSTAAGGKGGYSVGVLSINANLITAYLYTGGQGGSFTTNQTSGGFNGGGGSNVGTSGTATGTGGGASDIRLGTDAYAYRVIVAGGGGGGGGDSGNAGAVGGGGGGTSGINGTHTDGRVGSSSQSSTCGGSAGTQTSPGRGSTRNSNSIGAFGVGGLGHAITSSSGGGGGGWYGGGGGDCGGGGGGSGYIHQGTNSTSFLGSNYILTSASTTAGNTSFTSPSGASETGHSGNGYIRITIQNLLTISKPTGGLSRVWDGSSKSYILSGFDSNKMNISGSTSAIDPGYYDVSVTPKSGYYWTDGTTTAISLRWYIIKEVTKPTGGLSRLWDGNTKQYILNGFDSSDMIISGDVDGIQPQRYTVEINLKAYRQWADGTTDSITLNWYIIKKLIKPTSSMRLWTGVLQEYIINNFNSDEMTISGQLQGINPGLYSVTISLKDTTYYTWDDDTTNDVTCSWKIVRMFPVPTGSQRNWNGKTQSYAINNFNSTYMDISGTLQAVNEGSYTVTISLKNTDYYIWDDNTTTSKNAIWNIVIPIPSIWIKTDATTWELISESEDNNFILMDDYMVMPYANGLTKGLVHSTLSNYDINDYNISPIINGEVYYKNKTMTPGKLTITSKDNQSSPGHLQNLITNYSGENNLNVELTPHKINAVDLYGDVFQGKMMAAPDTSGGSAQVRNITYSTNSPTSSNGQVGDVWITNSNTSSLSVKTDSTTWENMNFSSANYNFTLIGDTLVITENS